MASFLRDEQPINLSINEATIDELHSVFVERASKLHEPILLYVIRFDRKGYIVSDIEDLKRHFREAKRIERLSFILETSLSKSTNRNDGAYIDLRLDATNLDQCFINVSSDEKDWVDASYNSIIDIFSKRKTLNGISRNPLVLFLAQIIGAIVVYVLSVWLAERIAPSLSIENPFVMSFIFVLIVLSNVWGYFSQVTVNMLNSTFPIINFHRPESDRWYWLRQGLVVAGALSIAVYAISGIFKFFSLVGKSILH